MALAARTFQAGELVADGVVGTERIDHGAVRHAQSRNVPPLPDSARPRPRPARAPRRSIRSSREETPQRRGEQQAFISIRRTGTRRRNVTLSLPAAATVRAHDRSGGRRRARRAFAAAVRWVCGAGRSADGSKPSWACGRRYRARRRRRPRFCGRAPGWAFPTTLSHRDARPRLRRRRPIRCSRRSRRTVAQIAGNTRTSAPLRPDPECRTAGHAPRSVAMPSSFPWRRPSRRRPCRRTGFRHAHQNQARSSGRRRAPAQLAARPGQ